MYANRPLGLDEWYMYPTGLHRDRGRLLELYPARAGGGSARLAAAALTERAAAQGPRSRAEIESVSTDTGMPPNRHEAFLARHLDSPLGARTCPPAAAASAARPVLPLGQGPRAGQSPRLRVVPAGAYVNTSCSWPPRTGAAGLAGSAGGRVEAKEQAQRPVSTPCAALVAAETARRDQRRREAPTQLRGQPQAQSVASPRGNGRDRSTCEE